jgi:hypothetical protein
MKNKKGFLLAEETLKIIIAVVCMVFLVYFLTSLYLTNVKNQKVEQAKSVVERIGEIANSVPENPERTDLSPGGWFLFSFTEGLKPKQCAGGNCVCICSKILIPIYEDSRQINECSKNGACKNIANIENFEKIEIKSPSQGVTNVEIKKQETRVIISEVK